MKIFLIVVGFILGVYVTLTYPELGAKSYSLIGDAIQFIKIKIQALEQNLISGV